MAAPGLWLWRFGWTLQSAENSFDSNFLIWIAPHLITVVSVSLSGLIRCKCDVKLCHPSVTKVYQLFIQKTEMKFERLKLNSQVWNHFHKTEIKFIRLKLTPQGWFQIHKTKIRFTRLKSIPKDQIRCSNLKSSPWDWKQIHKTEIHFKRLTST